MENEEYTFMELIMQLASDPDLGEDPGQRMGIAFGLYGNLMSLVM